MTISANDALKGELLLYQTEDGPTRIEWRCDGEPLWRTQALWSPTP